MFNKIKTFLVFIGVFSFILLLPFIMYALSIVALVIVAIAIAIFISLWVVHDVFKKGE